MKRFLLSCFVVSVAACGSSADPGAPSTESDALVPETELSDVASIDTSVDSSTPEDVAPVPDVSTPDAPIDDTPALDAPKLDAPTVDAGVCGCTTYSKPVTAGKLPTVLTETSGLAVSRVNDNMIWAHNDSGDTARVFAVDEKGASLGELTLPGVTANDWEDIAVGPCGASSCVFVGDIGDNAAARAEYIVYRFVEPKLVAGKLPPGPITFERFPYVYPDGKWNSETLMVHPTTGDIYVLTKHGTKPALYRFPTPLTPGVRATLVRVVDVVGLGGEVATGGDISPCGDRILVRTYPRLLEYRVPATGVFGDAFTVAPKSVPVATEGQGEAVAYRKNARGYFTVSEGSGATMTMTNCE